MPNAITSMPFNNCFSRSGSRFDSEGTPYLSCLRVAADCHRGRTINSGAMDATASATTSGTAAVTSPAPARNAASEAIAGAPAVP